MPDTSDLISGDIESYLKAHERKGLLRVLTCGSVDDGKSTLIGRLLWDTKLILEDQLEALEADSKRVGTQGGEMDFALLLDGLQAEREQGITIDVAYRFFVTEKRKFIVADAPGHEQYTRNMATGASTADLAVILVDARKGVLTQTKRHSFIASLLGIKRIVLAVNKMDLAGYAEETFEAVRDAYLAFAEPLGFDEIVCIPISALKGDNVIAAGAGTPWYGGPSLLEHLENVEIPSDAEDKPFRLPVQWVNRPHADFRGFSGTIAGGAVRPGDAVVVGGSGQTSTVTRVVTFDGDLERAVAGQAVTLTLADEIDISRGDILASADDRPLSADQFQAKVIWMDEAPLLAERSYILKMGAASTLARISNLKHKINVNTLEETAATNLGLNEIAECNLSLDRPLCFDPYADNRQTGSFILVDRFTNATVGAGMIDFALRRATNVHWQALEVDKAARAGLKGQNPAVLWFTGLSGSGKSTVANAVEKKLHARGKHTYILDGDNVRHGLNRDLGFTDADRVENIRRVAETAKLFADAGLIVLVAFISPFRSERLMARERMEDGEFLEIFVDTPLAICEQRDVKGLYAKARRGEIPNFTGIGSPYEPPETAEIHLDGASAPPDALADEVIRDLERRGLLNGGF